MNWHIAKPIRDGVISEQPKTVEQLTEHLKDLQSIYDAEDNRNFWKQNHIERILVVDDSEVVCRNIARSMESYGVQVMYALSGEEAIQIATDDNDFDAVLIDWYMTSMSGRQTAIELRKRTNQECPFILLTSYDINDTINKLEETSTDGL